MSKNIQDAGHGGTDPGAVAKGNTEKVYTLEAALYVNKRLLEHGIESDCTRYKDETLDESPRVSKVKNFNHGISHHFNAGGGSGAEFIHSIYGDGKFEHLLAEEFKAAGYPLRPKPVFCKKGTSGDYYYMHRRTGNCKVTIIEYDFVDGPQSEKIKDQAYREGMYECVVKAVCRREGVAYKPLKKEVEKVSELNKKALETQKESIRLGITDGKNPLREANNLYVWSALVPVYQDVETLKKIVEMHNVTIENLLKRIEDLEK